MESRVGPDMTEVKSYLYPHNYLSQSVAKIIGSSVSRESETAYALKVLIYPIPLIPQSPEVFSFHALEMLV